MENNNLKIINADVIARRITFQDVKEGGYTTPLIAVLVTIDNAFGTGKDGITRYQNVPDPNHPEYLISPSAQNIGLGQVFTVDSYTQGVTDITQGYYEFKEGVLNINYYTSDLQKQVEAVKGTNWLIGTGFDDLVEKYDSVIIDTQVYQIMKGLDYSTNGGTVIYLDRDLHRDVDDVLFAERSNLKALNNEVTKTIIARGASILADPLYRNSGSLERQNGVLKVIRNNIASQILFDRYDYAEANKLLLENLEIGRFLNLI